MKKHLPRWAKPLIDWVERELTAVMAVAIVLAFIFSQSFATDPDTAAGIVGTSTGSATIQQVNTSSLWEGGNELKFGTVITGVSDGAVLWGGDEVVNVGTGIFSPGVATMTTSANDGDYTLAVTAERGTIVVGGVSFGFSGYGTVSKPVRVSGGQLTVKLPAGSKIYSIKAVTPEDSSLDGGSSSTGSTPTIFPVTSLTVIPTAKSVVMSPVADVSFTPVVLVKNSVGALISDPQLTWTSSDTKIATVDSAGKVTPKAPGTVTISVKVTGTKLEAATSIKVLATVTAPTVEVTPVESEPSENLLDRFAGLLGGNKATETKEAPSTGGSEEDQAAVDKLAEEKAAETPQNSWNTSWGDSGYFSSDLVKEKALDTFAAVEAKKLAETGSDRLSQSEINAVLKTQPTTAKRITARLGYAVQEVAKTLGEIVTGRTIKVGEQTIQKKGVGQILVDWLKNSGLLPGSGATEPGTTGAAVGGGNDNE